MKFLIVFLLLCTGCGTLHADYVEHDRQDYEAMAPRIRKMLVTSEYDEVQRLDIEDALVARDLYISAAEAQLKQ